MKKVEEIKIKNIVKNFEVTFEAKKALSHKETEQNLDDLICHADFYDYIVAVASGLTCGLIDAIFANSFSLFKSQEWGTDKINKFTVFIANIQGCKSKSLSECVSFLEKKNPYPTDLVKNDFGGGLQHHLRDFTHHFSKTGLAFSIISQFTGKVYGTDINGNLVCTMLPDELIGKSFPEKISLGVIHWFFHMASDLAGSSNSTRAGKAGSGLPGPILSFVKKLSASPLFGPNNSESRKNLSIRITKLFNGTLIKENGQSIKFDFRTEIGLVAFQLERSFTVLLNETLVRTFYFLRRLTAQLDITNDIKTIDWKKTLPFKNQTIVRMLTVSSGMMTVVDLGRVALFWKKDNSSYHATTLASINIIGLGRFAFAIGEEIGFAIKRNKTIKQIIKNNEERNIPIDSKTLLYINKKWIIAETTRRCLLIMTHSLRQIFLLAPFIFK